MTTTTSPYFLRTRRIGFRTWTEGDLPLALGLGIILVAVVLVINAAAWSVRVWSERRAG